MTPRLYEVFGGTLRSELQIEELPASESRAPDWTLRVIDGSSTAPEGELLGMDLVYGNPCARLSKVDGLGLIFDDTGASTFPRTDPSSRGIGRPTCNSNRRRPT
jgi:hypothetical protein